MGRLDDKTALITGAARGLGAAIARRFAEEGATVIINDLSVDAARSTADALGGHAVAADVSNSADVARMFEELGRFAPRLDILVNNAGISGSEGRNDTDERVQQILRNAAAVAQGQPVEPNNTTIETTDEEWHRMLGVHVDGTFFCSRAALKPMAAQKSGSIINLGSIMGTFGRAGPTHYCTAKAAILGFTRSLAHEVADRNIRVNAIAPGWILTDMTSPFEAIHPLLAAQTPLGRIGEPDDIAWAAVYLASEEAKFVTGQTLSPNGGWYMSQ